MSGKLSSAQNSGTAQRANYLIGHPVGHSLSPTLYECAYKHLGLTWTYEAVDLPTEQDAETWLSQTDFFSVNVTTPYKPLALAQATVAGASAQLAGGANLLVCHKDARLAFNVDGQGCLKALAHEGFSVTDRAVVIAGTGPTALSILHACLGAKPASLTLLSRQKERSESVLQNYVDRCEELASSALDLAVWGGEKRQTLSSLLRSVKLRYGAYDTSVQALRDADLIIDATILGMHPNDPAPFDVDVLHEGQWVLDTVYGHGVSTLVQAARDRKAQAFDGFGMLVGQAVETVKVLIDLSHQTLTLSDDELFTVMQGV